MGTRASVRRGGGRGRGRGRPVGPFVPISTIPSDTGERILINGSSFTRAPGISEEDPRPSPAARPSLHSSTSVFPYMPGFSLVSFPFFAIHLDLSGRCRVSFSLAISGDALLSFTCRSSFLPGARTSLSLSLSPRSSPAPAELADYVTGCNVKYETLHPAVSLESKGSPRETRSHVSGRDTAKQERSMSDYTE